MSFKNLAFFVTYDNISQRAKFYISVSNWKILYFDVKLTNSIFRCQINNFYILMSNWQIFYFDVKLTYFIFWCQIDKFYISIANWQILYFDDKLSNFIFRCQIDKFYISMSNWQIFRNFDNCTWDLGTCTFPTHFHNLHNLHNLHKQRNFLLVLIKIAFLLFCRLFANMGPFSRIIPRIRFMWSLLLLSRNKSANLDKKTWFKVYALLCNAGCLDNGGKMWVTVTVSSTDGNHFWQRLFGKDPIITV